MYSFRNNEVFLEKDDFKMIKENMVKSNRSLLFSNFEKLYKAEQSKKNIEIPTMSRDSNIIEKDPVKKKTKTISKQIKRILEMHYNLLFAISNYSKKSIREGVNQVQDDILVNYNAKTFGFLIHLIKTKVDFKKVANLISLINFTNHGFRHDEHEEIILKVVENYPIRCVYILLKMDSFGFFSKKNDIFGIANEHITTAKMSLFSSNPFG